MIISIDGPDCAGKTTLADNLREILSGDSTQKIEVIHAGPPKQHPLDEYERPIYERRSLLNDVRLILDRWDIGEQVYPALLGRPTDLTPAVQRHIELFKRAYGFVEIIINPMIKRLQSCMADRPETERDYTDQQLAELHHRYANLEATGNHRLYFSLTDPCQSLDQILDLAYGLDEDRRLLEPFKTYVGQARPRFVLFGDRRGTGEQYLTMGDAPAFGPYPSTSGHYLLTHLDVPRMGGALANAVDVDDAYEIWDTVGRPPVVALGTHARRVLKAMKIPHGVAPHPQYVRRFHHHHGEMYATVIVQALQSQEDMSSWRP